MMGEPIRWTAPRLFLAPGLKCSPASGCDQVARVNLDNPAIGKLERECFERRA